MGAWSFGAVHVSRQAQDQALYIALGNQRRDAILVAAPLASAQRLARRSKAPARIAQSGANGLGTQIKTKQYAAVRQSLAKVDGVVANQSAGSASDAGSTCELSETSPV